MSGASGSNSNNKNTNQICSCGIASGIEPIAQYGIDNNNRYQALLHTVLDKVQADDDRKRTFTHEDICVHYVTRPSSSGYPDGVTYFIVAKNSVSRRTCFMLLYELEQVFLKDFVLHIAGGETIDTLRGDVSLNNKLKELVLMAVNDETDATGMAKKEIEEVKHIMVENVERLLERGERINMLVTKTDRMNNNATAFRRRTVHIRRRLWLDNIKYTAMLIGVGILLVYLLLAFICGFSMSECRA